MASRNSSDRNAPPQEDVQPSTLSDLRDRACAFGRDVAATARKAHDTAVQKTADHPHRALAIAAGAGAVLALLGSALASRSR